MTDPILEAAGEAYRQSINRRAGTPPPIHPWRDPGIPDDYWEAYIDDAVAVLVAAQAKREEIEAAACNEDGHELAACESCKAKVRVEDMRGHGEVSVCPACSDRWIAKAAECGARPCGHSWITYTHDDMQCVECGAESKVSDLARRITLSAADGADDGGAHHE